MTVDPMAAYATGWLAAQTSSDPRVTLLFEALEPDTFSFELLGARFRVTVTVLAGEEP